ncbi:MULTISPECIES: hypothetical protein [unclassified Acinetobacter]|uniref:hypothetical protein n=1 Tax=unclassified Acinetobacter TaxID=196816 RepID=UPI001F4ACEA5|nr:MULTISPECIES: hypothetical protein [unclassified Acinetobacter]MCH7353282.1 hypothetical protein [Acinetobacter sp. NIPH 2023]MCH7360664.1 hypothetical protein [Acinetobacter sp. NIPH 2024]MCL5767369.1 hypothetical protein [Acinetobacter sp. ANC5681]
MSIEFKTEYSDFYINPQKIQYLNVIKEEKAIFVHFTQNDYLRLSFEDDVKFNEMLHELKSKI